MMKQAAVTPITYPTARTLPSFVVLMCMVFFPIVGHGQIAKIIDGTGDGVNTLGLPGATVDASGNVYVTGGNTDNVFRVAASGSCSIGGTACTITEIIDASGDGVNILNRPAAATTDTAGNVYVVGQFSDNVFRISTPTTCSTGGTPCTIAEIMDASGDGGGNTLDTPLGVAVDGAGNVYVTGGVSDNVFRIAASTTCSTGGTPCTITEIVDATGDGTNASDQPFGVAVDSSGNVFVTHQNSDNVFKIATPGTCSTGGTNCTITEILDATGDGGGNTFDFGRGVVADSNGNVYASAIGLFEPARIFRIDTPGTCSTGGVACSVAEISERATAPQYSGLAVDDADSLFVAGGNGDDGLRIDTPTACSTSGPVCSISSIIDSTGDGVGNALDGPGQIAVHLTTVFITSSGAGDGVFRIGGVALPVELQSFSVE